MQYWNLVSKTKGKLKEFIKKKTRKSFFLVENLSNSSFLINKKRSLQKLQSRLFVLSFFIGKTKKEKKDKGTIQFILVEWILKRVWRLTTIQTNLQKLTKKINIFLVSRAKLNCRSFVIFWKERILRRCIPVSLLLSFLFFWKQGILRGFVSPPLVFLFPFSYFIVF